MASHGVPMPHPNGCLFSPDPSSQGREHHPFILGDVGDALCCMLVTEHPTPVKNDQQPHATACVIKSTINHHHRSLHMDGYGVRSQAQNTSRCLFPLPGRTKTSQEEVIGTQGLFEVGDTAWMDKHVCYEKGQSP